MWNDKNRKQQKAAEITGAQKDKQIIQIVPPNFTEIFASLVAIFHHTVPIRLTFSIQHSGQNIGT